MTPSLADRLRAASLGRMTRDELIDLKRACLGLEERARRELRSREPPLAAPSEVIECARCGRALPVTAVREHLLTCGIST